MKAANNEVTIVFGGAGTKWVREPSKSDHRLHGAFAPAEDKVGGAGAFGAKEEVEARGIWLLAELEDTRASRASSTTTR